MLSEIIAHIREKILRWHIRIMYNAWGIRKVDAMPLSRTDLSQDLDNLVNNTGSSIIPL